MEVSVRPRTTCSAFHSQGRYSVNVCRLLICLVSGLTATAAASDEINFNRDVRPILSNRCFRCHGPAEHDRQAELRLDQSTGADGAYRTIDGSAAIVPGSPEQSALWQRITSTGDDVMPPPDSGKKPLTAAEQDILRRWIESGAKYDDFWAFVPPRMPELPDVDDPRWNASPIDRLVMRRLSQLGRRPKPSADRRTLIRRLSLDLTGLPPTREEIQEFLTDESPDAFERQVDRLLASPHYGEHMGRYWLDLVRFADTNGIHHDHFRDMSPYRDWVIRAFNDNLPYDQFVSHQLAGDLYPEPTRDQLVASGFNRLHLIIDRGTALPEESMMRNVVDRVTSVGTAFLGLTVQCAVCHDHKYDPFTAKDFYQLYAFFNNLDADPETGGRQGSDFVRGLQPPYITLATETQQRELDDRNVAIAALKSQVRQMQQQLEAAGDEDRKSAAAASLEQAKQALAAAEKERDAFADTIPAAMVMKERAEIRPAYIQVRGAYDKPGDPVERNTPGFLPPLRPSGDVPTRLDLANWLVSPEHPLTARVAVNRFWQQIFGVGIVKTSEDFGAQGEWPTHPELLDSLAVSFRESGWDVKALVKQIVMSETWRQSSDATPEEYRSDPENRLLARGSRFRLDAEVIRDQILATSGLLNPKMFGRSVKPPQPEGLWETVTMPSSFPRTYEADTGDLIYRRSVYTFWKRGMPPPQMTLLNAPSREDCTARRERTNTPLQALLLLNEQQYLRAARHLAHASLSEGAVSPSERLVTLYETITGQVPDSEEERELLSLLDDLRSLYSDREELAAAICGGTELPAGVTAAELSAWTMLISTFYNLDLTRTRS